MGLDSHNSVKIWGNLNNFWLSLFDKVFFRGDYLIKVDFENQKFDLSSFSTFTFVFTIPYWIFLSWLSIFQVMYTPTYMSLCWSVHPSIRWSVTLLKVLQKSCLNGITAPAHLYATDAVMHTALFETDIKPCSMLLINFVFLIHRSISPSNSQLVRLSIRRAV